MTSKTTRSRVAFQGERGAFSEQAIAQLLGEKVELVPCPTFELLFAAVSQGKAECALAPIENSLAGSVHRTYDLLLEHSLFITAEVVIPITHNLIGCPNSSLSEITIVESHPVALAQCERFFAAHPHIKRLATDDTAGSVRHIIEMNDPTRAAIASHLAARVYGGSILRGHLEDHSENYTRFVLLTTTEETASDADKLSLVVRLDHQPGALARALEPFASRRIDLLKIESRPIRGEPWQYHFYLDLHASTRDEPVAGALRELKERATDVRQLGCYPAWRRIVAETDFNNFTENTSGKDINK